MTTTIANGTARWVKVLDQTRCIGCHACTTACKSENQVPLGVTRTYVKAVEVGAFPHVRRAFQVTRCNQCADAPCVAACPTAAMHTRPDGIVDFDKSRCVGCKACMAACPYDAIFINPEDHSAEKCNLCVHRLEVGLEPACATVCPTEAILVGDLNDPTSKVSRIVQREPVTVRRPEKGTRPGLFYKGAHQVTLDPLAAARPDGGIYAHAGQNADGRSRIASGHPDQHTSSAAALVSYDVGHQVPWGWRVSLYTWTKSVAVGVLAVGVLLAFLGRLGFGDPLLAELAPSVALGMLGVTGVLLIWDLKHPWRFWMLFFRPQWRSWLVRGAIAIAGYGTVATAFLVVGLLRTTGAVPASAATAAERVIGGFAIGFGVAAACYTAFLFAQAKARDLWQSPLFAPHLVVQAALAGASTLLLARSVGAPLGAGLPIEVVLAVASGAHLVFVAAETLVGHPSAHSHQAIAEMTTGRLGRLFWSGTILVAACVAAPWIGTTAGALALVGLLAYKHAYVQAGQAVPLA